MFHVRFEFAPLTLTESNSFGYLVPSTLVQQELRLKGNIGSFSKQRDSLPPKVDCLFSLSSPPASPEGEADGGQEEREKAKKILKIVPAP